MKKITTIILAAALLAALAGCDKSGNSSDSESPSSTSTTSEAVESSSESTSYESSTESQVSTSTDEVKILSRICYMRPIYKSTLDDPDWLENAIGEKFYEKANNWFGERNFEPKQFFDVKEGDKLENGLTVKEIVVYKNDDGSVKPEPEIRFEGELEMEGTLFLQQQDHDYFWTARELEFFPDSNKNPYIPMWVDGDEKCVQAQLFDNGDCVRTDCTFQLGNIDNADIDEDEIFDGKIAVKVKLTVDNITVGNTGGLSYTNCEYCYGHIVSCERID